MKIVTPWEGPKSILTQVALNDLADENSDMAAILKDNDAYRDWVPEMRMKIFHCAYDDVIPVENAQIAYDYFMEHGAGDNVELEEFLLYLPDLGSTHVGAAAHRLPAGGSIPARYRLPGTAVEIGQEGINSKRTLSITEEKFSL